MSYLNGKFIIAAKETGSFGRMFVGRLFANHPPAIVSGLFSSDLIQCEMYTGDSRSPMSIGLYLRADES